MDRALDSLSSEFKPRAMRVLARLVERGVHVLIVQTSRTLEEHRQNLANGTTHAMFSKHLPRRLRGLMTGGPDDDKADAIDLCPFRVYLLVGSDKLQWTEHETPESTAAWTAIGDEGEKEGLRWGGRWTTPHDPGHLEFVMGPQV